MIIKLIKNKLVIQITTMTEAMSCDALNMVICDGDLNPIDMDLIKEDWYNNWVKCTYAILEGEHYKDWTVLYSSYKIGQKVYFMKNNKISQGIIKNLIIATGKIESTAVIKCEHHDYTLTFGDFFKTPNELVSKLLNDFTNGSKK